MSEHHRSAARTASQASTGTSPRRRELAPSRPRPRRRAAQVIVGVAVLALLASGCYLREEAAEVDLLIGSGAVNPAYLDDPEFARVLSEQFNSLSPENELKWSFTQRERGVFTFAGLDRLVEFAAEHDMAVKGHGLISSCCNPTWVEQIQDPDALRAAMAAHFGALMGRYGDSMDRWDVVTEPLSIAGGSGLQDNHFHRVLGPGYIADAFRIAHAADPDAELFLNESLVEVIPTKRQELYELVSDLVDQGVPISGVGLEMHLMSMPEPGVITEMVEAYEALGLEVAITEMDVHMSDLTLQAHIYQTVITEALEAGIRDISFWGFTDKHLFTWVPGAKPLLFDEHYNGKPAFVATWTALEQFTSRQQR